MTLAEKGTGGAPPGAGNGVVGVDLCPASLEKEIDEMNDFVYEKVLATIFSYLDCVVQEHVGLLRENTRANSCLSARGHRV